MSSTVIFYLNSLRPGGTFILLKDYIFIFTEKGRYLQDIFTFPLFPSLSIFLSSNASLSAAASMWSHYGRGGCLIMCIKEGG